MWLKKYVAMTIYMLDFQKPMIWKSMYSGVVVKQHKLSFFHWLDEVWLFLACFQCSTQEFVTVCSALVSVREAVLPYRAALSAQLRSALLSDLTTDLPDLLEGASEWVQALDEKAAR